ncbi:hypothetical protein COCOBI_02-8370 [Coccomyxa sp. Obi]|nr:hypothetical protein COCOBI_02-8370 [Coccomyxa sp. Obi]
MIERSSLIKRYFLKRAAGFRRVCFRSWSAYKEETESWDVMHEFFAASIPQLAAVFAKRTCFLPDVDPYDDEEEELSESQQYSAMYWELLSPVLTNLVLQLKGIKMPLENIGWLCSMQQLQHLEFHGLPSMLGGRPVASFPDRLSLSALKVMRLEKFSHVWDRCHLDCPSLEALHLRDIQGLIMPTGLGSCSRLTTLDVAASPLDPPNMEQDASLLAAIQSVQTTVEVLDISGWGPALDGLVELISRLPRLHTLVAQRNGLTAVPALPATLRSLDLRANDFTEVPVQLESLTQLTSLALSSKLACANFQVRRPLDALISLLQLQRLTLVLKPGAYKAAYKRWDAQSLYYLGLAQHEIARSRSSLLLKF